MFGETDQHRIELMREDGIKVDSVEEQKKALRLFKRARKSFPAFIKLMMRDPKNWEDPYSSGWIDAPHHAILSRILESVESGAMRRVIVTMPPRHGKTEQVSKLFLPWFIGRNATKSGILASYSGDYSEDIGEAVRDYIEDARYEMIFPEFSLKAGSRSKSNLKTDKGGALSFVGAMGAITGRGGDVLITDDPVKDAIQAESQTYRDRLWEWFNKVFMSRAMTDEACALIVMTRWHEDDIVGRLTNPKNPAYSAEEAAEWQVISLPALAEKNDPLSREVGEPLWPARFSRQYLEGIKRRDPGGFSALYQGRPSPADGQIFKKQRIRWYAAKHRPRLDEMKIYAASDHAVGTDARKRHDKTCIVIGGVDPKGDVYLLDCWWKRKDTRDVVEAMLDLTERWTPRLWWAEDGHITKSIGPWLARRRVERGIPDIIVPVAPTKNKIQRSQSLQALISDGRVHFPLGTQWAKDGVEEMMSFPNGANDDFVDALSWFGYKVMEMHKGRSDVPDTGPKRGTWGWFKKQIAFESKQRALEQGNGW